MPQFTQKNKVDKLILYRYNDSDTVVKNHLLYADDGTYFAAKSYQDLDSIQIRKALADQKIIIDHLKDKLLTVELKSFKDLLEAS